MFSLLFCGRVEFLKVINWYILSDKLVGPNQTDIISNKVLMKLFRKSQFPHKSVTLFFIMTGMKDTLMNLCGK